MSKMTKKFSMLVKKCAPKIGKFLKENGATEEFVRDIVKLFFFLIILYLFKVVAW